MKSKRFLLPCLVLCLAIVSACQTTNPIFNQARVLPLKNNQIIELDAYDVVKILKTCGLNDKQIVRQGTDVRNCLAMHGAANIKVRGLTQSILIVKKPYVQISTRQRGNFVYDVVEKHLR